MESNNANERNLIASAPSAPEIERWLVDSLAALAELQSDEVDVQAPITSLGLESLTLFSLAGDLANWLGHDISATLLWEYPTIEAIAAHLSQSSSDEVREQEPQTPRALVAIQPHGTLAPLYLAHDVSGTLWCYSALARHLGTEQPLYGFQLPHSPTGSSDPLPLEELAALYVAELRSQQPCGPYHLGGFSVGGAIAFEMAQQLQQQGQQVALLLLMEAYYPGLDRRSPSLPRRVRIHARHLRDLENPQRVHYVRERVQKLVRGAPTAPTSSTPLEHMKEELLETRASEALEIAFARYKAHSYSGQITLVSARTQYLLADDLSAWRKVAQGGLQQHFVPGSHGTIVAEPHVPHLAALLKRCLHEAQCAKAL